MRRFPFIEQPVALRPAHAGDRPRIQSFMTGLSARTRYLRFFNGLRELTPPWLERFTRADPRADFTLLCMSGNAVLGMAQYSADPYPSRADFAVVVADAWQGLGIGSALLARTLNVAREAGMERMHAEVLAENRTMLGLLQANGFRVRRDPDTSLVLHADVSCNRTVAA